MNSLAFIERTIRRGPNHSEQNETHFAGKETDFKETAQGLALARGD